MRRIFSTLLVAALWGSGLVGLAACEDDTTLTPSPYDAGDSGDAGDSAKTGDDGSVHDSASAEDAADAADAADAGG